MPNESKMTLNLIIYVAIPLALVCLAYYFYSIENLTTSKEDLKKSSSFHTFTSYLFQKLRGGTHVSELSRDLSLNKKGLTFDEYKRLYQYSLEYNEEFWKNAALEYLSWIHPFTITKFCDFEKGNIAWFIDGQINPCYNALDRHVLTNPNKTAIIYEADEPNSGRTITYKELLEDVCRLSNWLTSLEYLKAGDVVTIYLPMIPEAVISMLACARLGLVHNVVFAGFSAEALSGRIEDSKSKLIITADQGLRGSKIVHLKQIVNTAIKNFAFVRNVLVYKRTGNQIEFNNEKDIWWHDAIPLQRPFAPFNMNLNSESPLFMLYTSGSTGKPKGLLHTIGGYLLYSMMTARFIFNFQKDDIFGCMADIGWITGHSYVVYGTLCNGITTVLFESTPTYPTFSRYWEVVQKYKLTQLYTAPTVIRTLKTKGTVPLEGYDLSSLRVIGSVGEPIHPDTWEWYYKYVGKERCTVVDTYWQTETGGIVIAPIIGGVPTKPGSASFPFFGIEPAILNSDTGTELAGNNITGVLAFKRPWPGMTRTIYGDHARYLTTYFNVYKGGYFYTGDGAFRDEEGFYFLTGRVDDVINVSGHRLSTCEIEAALSKHSNVSEAAVLGEPDELLGQGVCAFVVLKTQASDSVALKKELSALVRTAIGPIATPKRIVLCQDLPKTRSGKIMRRILRKLLTEKESPIDRVISILGDLTTLNNPEYMGSIHMIFIFIVLFICCIMQ